MSKPDWIPANPCEECNRDPEMSCKSTKFKFICSPYEVYKKTNGCSKETVGLSNGVVVWIFS